MEKIYKWILNNQKIVILLFTIGSLVSLFFAPQVKVNYDMNDYLPADSPSTEALSLMEEEFEEGVPNARVMVEDLTLPEGLAYKEKIEKIEGVTDVLWLDDTINITEPLEFQDKGSIESYYKEKNALYTVTINENKGIEAVDSLRELIGEDGYLEGAAVNTAVAAESTLDEISKIVMYTVPIVLIILIITTNSWFEPIILLSTIGISILLNAGSNILFGTISFVTSGAGNILLLAVSLDYSVFLLHRFDDNRDLGLEPKESMLKALKQSTGSILSSGLTTGISFGALMLMRFKIGPDLGIALAKGIVLSLLTVFFLLPVLVLKTYKILEKTRHKPLLPNFKKFGQIVSKGMVALALIFSIVVIPSFLAQTKNTYYYGADHIFGPETELGQDTEKINEKFGQSNTMVLMVPKGDSPKEIKMSETLKEIPEVTDIISFVDTVGPEIPSAYLEDSTLDRLESEEYSRMVLTVNAEYEGETAFKIIEEIRGIAQDYYPDSAHLAGESASTYDLMDTITEDNMRVNLISIGAVFIVLGLTFKSLILPFILVLSIETAVWINLSIPYFNNTTLFYFSYLIVGAIHLGATVDYAILMTSRYLENREIYQRKEAVKETVSNVTISVLTSGSAIIVVGSLLGYITTHGIMMQLGSLLARGAALSMLVVFFVLPGLLYLFDQPIQKLTKGLNFKNKETE